MNALTETKANYSLQTTVDDKSVATILAPLFATLHHENKGSLTNAVLENYLEVLGGLPEWALVQAVDEFRRGIRGNGRFIPMAAELNKAANGLIDAEKDRERRVAERERHAKAIQKQIAENEAFKNRQAGITDESRARVGEKLRATQAAIAEARLMDSEIRKGPTQAEITHERFKAAGRAATLKSMGVSQ